MYLLPSALVLRTNSTGSFDWYRWNSLQYLYGQFYSELNFLQRFVLWSGCLRVFSRRGTWSHCNRSNRHRGRVQVQLCWFLTWDLDGGEWLTPRSGFLTPGKRTPLPIVEEAARTSETVQTGVKEISWKLSCFFYDIFMEVHVGQLCYTLYLDVNVSYVREHICECVLWRENVTSSVLLTYLLHGAEPFLRS